MTVDKQTPMEPRLRFPEFRERREWRKTSLAEAFKTITNGEASSQDHQDNGEYPLFGRPEVVKRSPTFLFDAEAIILPGEGMSFQPRYFKGKFNLHQRTYALMGAKVIPFFAFYALDRFKSDLANSAVHSTVRSLCLPIIEKFTIPCPEIKAEQQKIADCLGSLDDLIAAKSRKLEVLRQHKQGLMQQLFPQPGETVPRLRFPEFHSTGDWHLRRLNDIAEPISDRVGTTKCIPMSVTTGVGLVSQEEKLGRIIAGDSYKDYIRLKTNDFAYNKNATKEFPQGYIARYTGTKDAGVPNSIFTCFRLNTDAVIPEYLDYIFRGNYHGRWLRRYITVGSRARGALSVSDDDFFAMPIVIPAVKAEQQRIADGLSSLDVQLAAESERLEALRKHKQGLMQQLFPGPDVE